MFYRGLADCVLVDAAEGTSVIYTHSASAGRLTEGNSRTAALVGVVALPVLTGF